MCTSIDGRILVSRWPRLPAVGSSAALFERTAASFGVPAWLVGSTTLREFAARSRALPRSRERVPRVDHLAQPGAHRFAIGADARGQLRFREGAVQGDHVVLLLGSGVSDDYLAHLRIAGVSYLFCGAQRIDLRLALQKLRSRLGLRKLMLEGGGTFNGAMLQAGLVDEVSQVIVPVVDGGAEVPGLFDLPGHAPAKALARLQLRRSRRLPGGVVWSHYRVRTLSAHR
jgi:riboflavin biosynthesis pyrimidine reductase